MKTPSIVIFCFIFADLYGQVATQNVALTKKCPQAIRVASWNTKHLGRKNFDYPRATRLLQSFDGVALQEVNSSKSGVQALKRLKVLLEESTHVRWCSALSLIPSAARERYAYLWRDDRLQWVRRKSGKSVVHCPEHHFTAALLGTKAHKIRREPAQILLQSRHHALKFYFATVHLVPTAKKPRHEVGPLVASFLQQNIPIVLAGDFNLAANDPAFQPFRQRGWKNLLPAETQTSLKMKSRALNAAYDNIWIYLGRGKRQIIPHNCHQQRGSIDTYRYFKGVPKRHIYNRLSDHIPIWVDLYPIKKLTNKKKPRKKQRSATMP